MLFGHLLFSPPKKCTKSKNVGRFVFFLSFSLAFFFFKFLNIIIIIAVVVVVVVVVHYNPNLTTHICPAKEKTKTTDYIGQRYACRLIEDYKVRYSKFFLDILIFDARMESNKRAIKTGAT